MPGDIKSKYPASGGDTSAVTISLASLATSSTLLVGREATFTSNTTDLDIDKPVTGQIRVGTTPTANTVIEVWATMPSKIATGGTVITWPASMTGADAAFTFLSTGIKNSCMRLIASIQVDSATSDRFYPFTGRSIGEAFACMPPMLSFFVVHNTGVNLNATATDQYIHLHRYQVQYT